MSGPNLSTTLPRAGFALLVGAVVAGPTTMLVIIAPAIGSSVYDLNTFFAQFAFASIVAILAFAVGLLFLAAPCWFFLHKSGHRTWHAAATLGGLLGFVATFLLYVSPTFPLRPEGSRFSFGGSGGLLVEDNVITILGWQTFIGYSAIYGALCALIGILIWRLAYRAVPIDEKS